MSTPSSESCSQRVNSAYYTLELPIQVRKKQSMHVSEEKGEVVKGDIFLPLQVRRKLPLQFDKEFPLQASQTLPVQVVEELPIQVRKKQSMQITVEKGRPVQFQRKFT